MERARRRIALAAVVAATLLPAAAAPAVAQPEKPYGELSHSGDPGLHWILDMFLDTGAHLEAPAVTCRYDGTLVLRSLVIQQPVIFASLNGSQRVAWRAEIEHRDGGTWDHHASTSTSQANATKQVPADLAPKTYQLPGDPTDHDAYRVVYRMLWYDGGGPPMARAAHLPYWFRATRPAVTSQARALECESIWSVGTSAAPAGFIDDVWGPHEGQRGKHWILDNVGPHPEYAAATCLYDDELRLKAIRVRRPIVFARDATGGVDTQDIGWKIRVQYTFLNSTETDWLPLSQSSEIRKRATDGAWADFLPRTIPVHLDEPFLGARVVYQLTWYRTGTDVVRGSARHAPRWYVHQEGGMTVEDPNPYCYASMAN